MGKKIVVVGAGLSGLTAAISCAKLGYEVTVYEKTDRIGKSILPTIFSTPLVNITQFEQFLGINLRKQLGEVKKFEVIFSDSIYNIAYPKLKSYNLEKGPRRSSIDNYLYKLAEKEGVNFEFNREITDFDQIKANKCILAVGINGDWMKKLRIKYQYHTYQAIHGYTRSDQKILYKVIIDNQISPGWYAHVGSLNGILSAVIINKMGISQLNWNRLVDYLRYRKILKNNFKKYIIFKGYSPTRIQLFADKFILAGTVSGSNDPMVCYGALQSLISGRIAAIAVEDPKKASSMFNKVFGSRFLANLLSSYSSTPNNESTQRRFLKFTPWSIKKSFLNFDISKVI